MRADRPKLHDMFKARDVKAWQREFSVVFPVRVGASILLLINIFLDIVAYRKQMRDYNKTCPVGLLIRSIFR